MHPYFSYLDDGTSDTIRVCGYVINKFTFCTKIIPILTDEQIDILINHYNFDILSLITEAYNRGITVEIKNVVKNKDEYEYASVILKKDFLSKLQIAKLVNTGIIQNIQLYMDRVIKNKKTKRESRRKKQNNTPTVEPSTPVASEPKVEEPQYKEPSELSDEMYCKKLVKTFTDEELTELEAKYGYNKLLNDELHRRNPEYKGRFCLGYMNYKSYASSLKIYLSKRYGI